MVDVLGGLISVGDDATRKMSRSRMDTVKVELLSRMVTVLETGALSS